MDILAIAESYGPGFYTKGLIEGFIAAGHSVRILKANVWGISDQKRLSERITRNDDNVEKLISKNHYDAFFIVKGDAISRQMVKRMKTLGIFTVVLQIDDPMWFSSVSKKHSSEYDLVYTTEKNSISIYKKFSIDAKWLPFGFDSNVEVRKNNGINLWRSSNLLGPRIFEPAEVIFVGDPLINYSSSTRYQFCMNLKKQVPLRLMGSDKLIDEWEGRVELNDMKTIAQNSKINLAFSDQAEGSIGLKMRHTEIPGYNGFMLSQDIDYLSELFVPSKEIETFDSEAECVEKIRFYLDHTGTREKIRIAGYKRAYKEHTYLERSKTILRDIKKERKGLY